MFNQLAAIAKSPIWIPVTVKNRGDNGQAQEIPAMLVDFTTVQRSYGENENMRLDSIIFGIVITENGFILARRLIDLQVRDPL